MKTVNYRLARGLRVLAFSAMAIGMVSSPALADGIKISPPYDAYENAALLMYKGEQRDRAELKALFRSTIGELDPVVTPWCAGFVDAMLIRSGKRPLGSLWARDFLKYGERVTQPRRGDIVVLSRGPFYGHVGFLHTIINVDGQTLVGVLGGNTEGRDHPGRVDIAYFPLSMVLGIRRG